MLIDKDSRPRDTILYLSAQLLTRMKHRGRMELALINELYHDVGEQHPLFKFDLALSFLFLVGRVEVRGGELIYVPRGVEDQ